LTWLIATDVLVYNLMCSSQGALQSFTFILFLCAVACVCKLCTYSCVWCVVYINSMVRYCWLFNINLWKQNSTECSEDETKRKIVKSKIKNNR
jgi:hypothetical protein